MDTYRTEEEQLEILKKWWSDHGQGLLLAVCLGCAVMFGWRFWQDSQLAKREAASVGFQELVEAVNVAQQDPGNDVNLATVDHLLEKMRGEYSGSGYSVFAELLAARQLAAEGKLDQAEQTLRQALTSIDDDALKTVASMRLARVLAAQSETVEAASMLDGLIGKHAGTPFEAALQETKGDIFLMAKDYAKAEQAYTLAANALNARSQTVPRLLEMKQSFTNSFL